METPRIFHMPFSDVYPLYIKKAEKKGRTRKEVDQIIFWLTGYDESQCFSDQRSYLRLPGEEIEDELMKKIRYLDKLIDELAKGRAMEKILRK